MRLYYLAPIHGAGTRDQCRRSSFQSRERELYRTCASKRELLRVRTPLRGVVVVYAGIEMGLEWRDLYARQMEHQNSKNIFFNDCPLRVA